MKLRKEKPLVVSVGGMAASGGYYLSCAGTKIVAEPTSIVGSIGVVGGKLSFGKALEEYGIGRPSTYASIIQTLLGREYVMLDNRRFRPTDVGRVVAKFLSNHFSQYVDYEFTARMEDELDAVSRGEEEWVPLLHKFWTPFKAQVADKMETVSLDEAKQNRVLGNDPATGKPISVRLGRFGPFAQIGTKEDEDKPKFASLQAGQSLHTITLEEALELFKLPRMLGHAPDGKEVSAAVGRFGPFVKHGSTYASIKAPDSPYTIELPRALQLIEEKEEQIRNRIILSFDDGAIEVLNGKFGPYITNGERNGKIPKDRDPKTLTREECVALLEAGKPVKKKAGRFGRAAKKAAPVKKAAVKKEAPAKKVAAKKAAASSRRFISSRTYSECATDARPQPLHFEMHQKKVPADVKIA